MHSYQQYDIEYNIYLNCIRCIIKNNSQWSSWINSNSCFTILNFCIMKIHRLNTFTCWAFGLLIVLSSGLTTDFYFPLALCMNLREICAVFHPSQDVQDNHGLKKMLACTTCGSLFDYIRSVFILTEVSKLSDNIVESEFTFTFIIHHCILWVYSHYNNTTLLWR